ncbi:MAG: Asp-tRNA(Asn)/Glu-tRNA(Gln) amidotransferase subunit GatC [Candidatus Paceibacterota bacterium]
MISKEDVKKLAILSRLEISDSELESVAKEIGSILEYVGTIDSAIAGEEKIDAPEFYNNLREDDNSNETCLQTETLLASAPKREGDFVKVKKVM